MQRPSLLKLVNVLLTMIFAWVMGAWLQFAFSPIVFNPEGVHYFLQPGTTTNTLTESLTKANLIDKPFIFKGLVHLVGRGRSLKAGEYIFTEGTTPFSLINRVTTGKGSVYHAFTIVGGWNFQQLRAALQQNPYLQHVINQWSDSRVMQHLQADHLSPEGMFYPETYYFMANSSDLSLLRRAYHLMQSKLNTAWVQRDPDLPFSEVYSALIAASLIEKEAYLDQERPVIAGVLVNRMHQNMLLQFDPTIIYGMGSNYHGQLKKKDIHRKTVTNTYVNKGLPPTPIAIPTEASLQAVLHPQKNDYLYFVAKQDGTGGHHFSVTLAEHNQAIEAARLAAKVIKHPFFNDILLGKYFEKNCRNEEQARFLHVSTSEK